MWNEKGQNEKGLDENGARNLVKMPFNGLSFYKFVISGCIFHYEECKIDVFTR